MSLGLSWQHHTMAIPFVDEDCCVSPAGIFLAAFSSYKMFRSNTLGLRGVFTILKTTSYGDARPFLYFTGSYNYNLTMDMLYPKVGFAVGFY